MSVPGYNWGGEEAATSTAASAAASAAAAAAAASASAAATEGESQWEGIVYVAVVSSLV
eukprot:evm.model.NODE_44024_length_24327_cov_35.874256.6